MAGILETVGCWFGKHKWILYSDERIGSIRRKTYNCDSCMKIKVEDIK